MRLDVVSAGVRSMTVAKPAMQSVGLPRFSRGKDGSLSFGRPKINSIEKVRLGGLITPGIEKLLKPKALPGETTETPMVTVEVRDPITDEVLEVTEQKRDDFYGIVDAMGMSSGVKASWAPKESIPGVTPDSIGLRLTGHDEAGQPIRPFEELTAQLEVNNITKWKGLTWKRGNIVQEIVWDGAVRKKDAWNENDVRTRTLAIKTTRDGKDLGLERMSSYQFAEWLERINAGDAEHARPMEDIRMVKTIPETIEDREQAVYRQLGWIAVPHAPDEMDRLYRRRRQLEAAIHAQIKDGPESILAKKDRIAAWLLDYPDVLDENGRTDKIIDDIYGSLEARRRISTLNKAIKRHGLIEVYDAAMRFKNTYLKSMRDLGVVVGDTDQSHSKAVEILADAMHAQPDLLYDSAESRTTKRRLLDKLVGQTAARVVTKEDGKDAYAHALIRKKRELVPTEEVNADGQQVIKAKEQLQFHTEFFTGSDSPAISKAQIKAWHQREAFRIPMKNMAQSIYLQLSHDETPSDEEYEQFGRLLRRSVGH